VHVGLQLLTARHGSEQANEHVTDLEKCVGLRDLIRNASEAQSLWETSRLKGETRCTELVEGRLAYVTGVAGASGITSRGFLTPIHRRQSSRSGPLGGVRWPKRPARTATKPTSLSSA
jgi:hypothetical protein